MAIPETLRAPIHRHWPAALVLAVPGLLPFARLVELPILVMMILGIRLLATDRERVLGAPAFRLFVALFACYWIPGVLSAFDATDPGKAWSWVAAQSRFVLVGAFVTTALDAAQRRIVVQGMAVLVLFWTVDVLFQAAVGYNLLGMPLSPERLNGVFGPTNIKLGLVLAAFGALAIEPFRSGRRIWLVVCYVLLLAAIVLIGTRAAWIMFAVVTAAHVYLYARGRPSRVFLATLMVTFATAVLFIGGYHGSDSLRDRVDRSLRVLDGDAEAIDEAVSMRLPIWETGAEMAKEHWINGVGVRSFRYAYPAYADADDPWVRADSGAAHAHQLILEVFAETGVIGGVGFGLALFLALRAWRTAGWRARLPALPWAICLAAVLFPINTHLAFYSTFWSVVFWWLVLMYCAYLQPPGDPETARGEHG